MKNIKTIEPVSFGLDDTSRRYGEYSERSAARAVVRNHEGGIYLLYVHTKGYHKLPGGGIDDGESIEEAVKREAIEEIGCRIELDRELGEIVEYRDFEDLKQISYCYTANQIGEKVEQSLEQSEIDEGHDLVIARDIKDAISIMEDDSPESIEGKYIRMRDLCFLKEALLAD